MLQKIFEETWEAQEEKPSPWKMMWDHCVQRVKYALVKKLTGRDMAAAGYLVHSANVLQRLTENGPRLTHLYSRQVREAIIKFDPEFARQRGIWSGQ